MAGSTDEGWDETGTAVAGPAYDEAIAKSDPDFEAEVGTAVAGETYAESIRKSAPIAAQPAPEPVLAKPGIAQRSPTMAFGTPVLLRAPAITPSPGSPVVGKATSLGITAVGRASTPLPGTPVVARPATPAGSPVVARPATPAGSPVVARPPTPAPGTPISRTATTPMVGAPAVGRAETEREVVSAAARNARPKDGRRPAPSPHVDQPFGASERKSGVIGVPDVPMRDRRSGAIAAPVETSDRRSGPIAKPASQRLAPLLDKPIVEKRRFDFDDSEAVDDGAEDDSASNLEEFDNAQTMGQPQRRDSEPLAVHRPTPAPLRPTPVPMRAQAPSQQLDAQGYEPAPATPPPVDAYLTPSPPGESPMPAPMVSMQPNAPLPSTYPMVSHEAMQAFRSPLSAPLAPMAAAAPAVAPKRRVAVIAVCALAVVALGIGAFALLGGDTTTTAAKTDPKPAMAETKPTAADEATPTKAAADEAKPDEAKPTEAKPAMAETKPVETKPAEAKPAEAKPVAKVPAKPAVAAKKPAKAAKKTAAAPKKATVRKTKKPVRKAPVRKAAPKKKAAAKCSGLDCL